MSSSRQKRTSHRIDDHSPVYSLAALKEKHISLVKQLKFIRKAQPKIAFADCEIKPDLNHLSPAKEKLLFLHSENKRYIEKAFFGDIDNKKCDVMSGFYSDYKDILNDIVQKKSTFETSEELERYLTSIKDNLSKDLESAQLTLQNHQKAVVEKDREVQRLTAEMIKAKEKSLEDVTELKKSLQKGETLTDSEILRLSLRKCQETNSKLTSAVERYGKHLDHLREQYLWKRDHLVAKLAKEQIKTAEEQCQDFVMESGEVVEEMSNPSTPKGSMYDLLLERGFLIGAVAKISQNTEELTKYFYKLADLKNSLEEVNIRTKGHSMFSTKRSSPVVLSNMVTEPVHDGQPKGQ